MKKLKLTFMFLVYLCAFLSFSCNSVRTPKSVKILDLSSKYNKQNIVSIAYEQENSYKNLWTDVLFKVNEDDVCFVVSKEMDKKHEVVLPKKDTYYSLTKLCNKDNNLFTKYKDAVSKNLIFYAKNKSFKLTIKAVVGEVDEYHSMLLNTQNVSNECYINIVK